MLIMCRISGNKSSVIVTSFLFCYPFSYYLNFYLLIRCNSIL
uniref:Uncharacterized protein n=1 Tax=Arundo donax TaxID=35708 RepID=A0A0A9H1Q2_ARUDO